MARVYVLVNEGLEVFQSITTPLVEAGETADVYIGIETHWHFPRIISLCKPSIMHIFFAFGVDL